MNSLLLLAALLAAQCSGGRCPSPMQSSRFGPSFPAMTPMLNAHYPTAVPQVIPIALPRMPERQPVYEIKQHRVDYKGLTFVVEGYRTDRGTIRWDQDNDFNRLSYAAALASAKATPVVIPIPPPPLATPVVIPVAKPTPKAEPPVNVGDTVPNYGLRLDKIGEHKKAEYRAHGDEAHRFVSEVADPEANRKLHVTVIGSDDARAPVMNDLLNHPTLTPFRDRLLIQGYKPGEWPVDSTLGFVANGQPSIVIQNSRGPGDPKGGRVIWRAMDYSTGPTGLAEAIRKADPNYKPGSDPGPAAPTLPTETPIGLIAMVAVIVGVILFVPRKEG